MSEALDVAEKLVDDVLLLTEREAREKGYEAGTQICWVRKQIDVLVNRGGMRKFVTAIRRSLRNENYHAALAVTLMLPDLAGWADTGNKKVGQRYRTWWDAHAARQYLPHVEAHTALTGADCYALRCAYLHQGIDEPGSKSDEAIQGFEFIVPVPRMIAHCNVRREANRKVLQLDVRWFCEDVCSAFETWLDGVVDTGALTRIKSSMSITMDCVPRNPLG